jgi:hypothetical protein
MEEIMTIYEEMKAAGVEIDNHESDMYVPNNETTRKIVEEYEYKCNVTTFKSAIDGTPWLDIPFSFDPWWDEAEKTVASWVTKVKEGV